MAATCPGCGKTVSGEKATCYFCGAFLQPRLECPKCKRAIPQTRSTCHFCGTSLAGAKLADPAPAGAQTGPPPEGATSDSVAPAAAKPAAAKPAPATLSKPPASLARPDIVLEKQSAFGAWCEAHQAEIDVGLFIIAAPIALCAIATQAVVSIIGDMMGG